MAMATNRIWILLCALWSCPQGAQSEGSDLVMPAPLVIFPSLDFRAGKGDTLSSGELAARMASVLNNIHVLKKELGNEFKCVVNIDALIPEMPHNFDPMAFEPCQVNFIEDGTWTDGLKALSPEDLAGVESVFFVREEVHLAASTLHELMKLMQLEQLEVVSASYESEKCTLMRPHVGSSAARGTGFLEFKANLFSIDAFKCLRNIVDPSVNRIGLGYENMFGALCTRHMAVCDTCAIEVDQEPATYSSEEAIAQRDAWRSILGKRKLRGWNDCDLGSEFPLRGLYVAPVQKFSHIFEDEQSVLAQDLAMLSEAQLRQFEDIRQGKIQKTEIELVLAQYDEDTTWSDVYAPIRTIYCKGANGPQGCIQTPNVGREGHTYLQHIVDNYDNLAKWTVFSQAGEPTKGYAGHRSGGGHMLPGTSFHDYILRDGQTSEMDDGALFIITGALHLSTLRHSLRTSYTQAMNTGMSLRQSQCPKQTLMDGWEPFMELGWFKEFIAGKCDVPEAKVADIVVNHWKNYIRLPWPEQGTALFSQGARFAVSRERIWQRPKAYYDELLMLVSYDADPCVNYLNEWLWYYMIGKPTHQPCDTYPENPTEHSSLRFLQSMSGCTPISGQVGCATGITTTVTTTTQTTRTTTTKTTTTTTITSTTTTTTHIPDLLSATLNSDASGFALTFDGPHPTCSSPADCATIFDAAALAQFGSNPQCQFFMNCRAFRITFGNGASVAPGDSITVSTGQSLPLAMTVSYPVGAVLTPSANPAPQCSLMTFSAGGSTGNFGRNFGFAWNYEAGMGSEFQALMATPLNVANAGTGQSDLRLEGSTLYNAMETIKAGSARRLKSVEGNHTEAEKTALSGHKEEEHHVVADDFIEACIETITTEYNLNSSSYAYLAENCARDTYYHAVIKCVHDHWDKEPDTYEATYEYCFLEHIREWDESESDVQGALRARRLQAPGTTTIPIPDTLDVRVTVSNWLGSSDTATSSVQINQDTSLAPSVQSGLPGHTTTVAMKNDDELVLVVDVLSSTAGEMCGQVLTDATVNINWEYRQMANQARRLESHLGVWQTLADANLMDEDFSQKILKISRFSFAPSTTHEFRARARYAQDGFPTEAIVTFFVTVGPRDDPVAVISASEAVSSVCPFTLSGLNSVNPGYNPSDNLDEPHAANGLSYLWSLVDCESPCDITIGGWDQPTLTIRGGALSVGPHSFTLMVTRAREDLRASSAVATTQLSLTAGAIPPSTIITPWVEEQAYVSEQSSFTVTARIVASDNCVVSSEIDWQLVVFQYENPMPIVYVPQMSASQISGNVWEVSTSDVGGSRLTAGQIYAYALLIGNDDLSKQTLSMLRTGGMADLSALNAAGIVAAYSIPFTSDGAPTGDAPAIAPLQAEEVQGKFTFSASGWTDEDPHLSYAFYVFPLGELTTGTSLSLNDDKTAIVATPSVDLNFDISFDEEYIGKDTVPANHWTQKGGEVVALFSQHSEVTGINLPENWYITAVVVRDHLHAETVRYALGPIVPSSAVPEAEVIQLINNALGENSMMSVLNQVNSIARDDDIIKNANVVGALTSSMEDSMTNVDATDDGIHKIGDVVTTVVQTSPDSAFNQQQEMELGNVVITSLNAGISTNTQLTIPTGESMADAIMAVTAIGQALEDSPAIVQTEVQVDASNKLQQDMVATLGHAVANSIGDGESFAVSRDAQVDDPSSICLNLEAAQENLATVQMQGMDNSFIKINAVPTATRRLESGGRKLNAHDCNSINPSQVTWCNCDPHHNPVRNVIGAYGEFTRVTTVRVESCGVLVEPPAVPVPVEHKLPVDWRAAPNWPTIQYNLKCVRWDDSTSQWTQAGLQVQTGYSWETCYNQPTIGAGQNLGCRVTCISDHLNGDFAVVLEAISTTTTTTTRTTITTTTITTTEAPTPAPTPAPTAAPTPEPTPAPTAAPTPAPTPGPTPAPTPNTTTTTLAAAAAAASPSPAPEEGLAAGIIVLIIVLILLLLLCIAALIWWFCCRGDRSPPQPAPQEREPEPVAPIPAPVPVPAPAPEPVEDPNEWKIDDDEQVLPQVNMQGSCAGGGASGAAQFGQQAQGGAQDDMGVI